MSERSQFTSVPAGVQLPSVVNAIVDVCAAPPGIVNRMQLPFVRGAYTLRSS